MAVPKSIFVRISTVKNVQETLAFRLVLKGSRLGDHRYLRHFQDWRGAIKFAHHGTLRTAQKFLIHCRTLGIFERIARVRVDLFGSLAKPARGMVPILPCCLGSLMMTQLPVIRRDSARAAAIRTAGELALGGEREIRFEPANDLIFNLQDFAPFHPNALTFTAYLEDGTSHAETYYSIGGGFVVQEEPVTQRLVRVMGLCPCPFPSTPRQTCWNTVGSSADDPRNRLA